MSIEVIDQIVAHAESIKNGEHEACRPGMPLRISDAAEVGDYAWQGDLKITIISTIPSNYTKCKSPSKQLVPGNTQGSRHCLDSLRGVEVHMPEGWGPKYEGLLGPCLVIKSERTIEHPTHGHVTIPKGFMVQCTYQRAWDSEQRRERRNAD